VSSWGHMMFFGDAAALVSWAYGQNGDGFNITFGPCPSYSTLQPASIYKIGTQLQPAGSYLHYRLPSSYGTTLSLSWNASSILFSRRQPLLLLSYDGFATFNRTNATWIQLAPKQNQATLTWQLIWEQPRSGPLSNTMNGSPGISIYFPDDTKMLDAHIAASFSHYVNEQSGYAGQTLQATGYFGPTFDGYRVRSAYQFRWVIPTNVPQIYITTGILPSVNKPYRWFASMGDYASPFRYQWYSYCDQPSITQTIYNPNPSSNNKTADGNTFTVGIFGYDLYTNNYDYIGASFRITW